MTSNDPLSEVYNQITSSVLRIQYFVDLILLLVGIGLFIANENAESIGKVTFWRSFLLGSLFSTSGVTTAYWLCRLGNDNAPKQRKGKFSAINGMLTTVDHRWEYFLFAILSGALSMCFFRLFSYP